MIVPVAHLSVGVNGYLNVGVKYVQSNQSPHQRGLESGISNKCWA